MSELLKISSRLPRNNRMETSHVHAFSADETDHTACEFYENEKPEERLSSYGTP